MHTTLLFASCNKAVSKPKNYTMKPGHDLNTEDSRRVRHWVYVLQRSLHFMEIGVLTVPKASGRSNVHHACWFKYDQNTATKAYTPLQATGQEKGKPRDSLLISWLKWQKRLGVRNILATWSLTGWVFVIFVKVANAGRSYHCVTHQSQVLWVVLTCAALLHLGPTVVNTVLMQFLREKYFPVKHTFLKRQTNSFFFFFFSK